MLALVSSPRALAFPSELQGRRIAKSQQLFQLGVGFRGCSHLLMFRPASLLAPQIAPTLASRQSFPIDAGRPGTFTSAPITVGYLPRAADTLAVQIQAIDGKGTSTPLDQQLCRLLQFATHRRLNPARWLWLALALLSAGFVALFTRRPFKTSLRTVQAARRRCRRGKSAFVDSSKARRTIKTSRGVAERRAEEAVNHMQQRIRASRCSAGGTYV